MFGLFNGDAKSELHAPLLGGAKAADVKAVSAKDIKTLRKHLEAITQKKNNLQALKDKLTQLKVELFVSFTDKGANPVRKPVNTALVKTLYKSIQDHEEFKYFSDTERSELDKRYQALFKGEAADPCLFYMSMVNGSAECRSPRLAALQKYEEISDKMTGLLDQRLSQSDAVLQLRETQLGEAGAPLVPGAANKLAK